jgi:DNA-binding transcriptional regulator YhcF (GntR family)
LPGDVKKVHQVTLARTSPMLQQSKLIRSRDEWKTKAVQRATEIRERRKAEKRSKEKIAELCKQIGELSLALEDAKKNS